MPHSAFIRVINRRQVLVLAFGAMVGWSWVALTGVWTAGAGAVGAMLAGVGPAPPDGRHDPPSADRIQLAPTVSRLT